jgi:hypothetical protein
MSLTSGRFELPDNNFMVCFPARPAVRRPPRSYPAAAGCQTRHRHGRRALRAGAFAFLPGRLLNSWLGG